MVEHLLDSPCNKKNSRLTLAVVGGTLQSHVEATPRCHGQKKLQALHKLIRPEGMGTGISPYCTKTRIDEDSIQNLKWWQAFLQSKNGRYVWGSQAGTLVPTFGDGSGTDTGGTIQVPKQKIYMWKGTWAPFVFNYSSNWKKLNTLLETIKRLTTEVNFDLNRCTTFYFTNSITAYWIAASGCSSIPRLHVLMAKIKQLEAKYNFFLHVIHVPGVVMIEQGTDGLSRGIWLSNL